MAASGGLTPGVLNHQEILALCGLSGSQPVESTGQAIDPCSRIQVKSASYDLRLGSDFYVSSLDGSSPSHSLEVSRLVPATSESVVIQPNQIVVISTLEKLALPTDIIGHLTLKQDILLEGLLMGSQSQVDAGYTGWIYPLLYNLTDRPVTLKLGSSIIRLELVRLAHRTDQPYKGDYQGRRLASALKEPFGSSLNALQKSVAGERARVTGLREDVEDTRRKIDRSRLLAYFATAAVTLVAIATPIILAWVTGFAGEVHETRDRVSRFEGELRRSVKLEEDMGLLKSRTARLECQLRSDTSNVNRKGRC